VLGFPVKVFDRILHYTLDSSTGHAINLDSAADFAHLWGTFYMNRELHYRYFDKFLLHHTFEISMTADTTANFDFSKLEGLLNVSFESVGDHVDLRAGLDECGRKVFIFGRVLKFCINLHIHSGMPTSPYSSHTARVNLMPLIAATFGAKGDCYISIHTHSADGQVQIKTISIRDLRLWAVGVLRKYVMEYCATDAGMLCPEMWLRAEGSVDIVPTGSVALRDVDMEDLAKEYSALWSAWRTGYVGRKEPPVAEADGLARACMCISIGSLWRGRIIIEMGTYAGGIKTLHVELKKK
jgi:hypothetical protein